MRMQRLLMWTTCLLLGSVSGCNRVHHEAVGNHHKSVGGGIDDTGNPYNDQTRSMLVDEAGTIDTNGKLTIKRPKGTPPNKTFEIQSTLNGSPAPICSGDTSGTITTTLDFSCTVVNTDGDYIITVKEHGTNDTDGTVAAIPPFTAYIRSCKNCK